VCTGQLTDDKRMIGEPARRLDVDVTQLALGRRDDEVKRIADAVGCAANVLDHVERLSFALSLPTL